MMTDALNQDTGRFLLPDIDATVVAGYTTQKSILIGLLSNHEVGAYEILSDNVGLLAVCPFKNTGRYTYPVVVISLIDHRYRQCILFQGEAFISSLRVPWYNRQ